MRWIAGVDEAGRGPLAGPVVAAAVVLDPNFNIDGIGDSKKISEKKRMLLAEAIRAHAIAWSIGLASANEIDEFNIHQATLLAMSRAIDKCDPKPHHCQIDGKFAPQIAIPCETIIKGDATVAAIGAASIIAKVYRDQLMYELDTQYPQYAFAQHKGYGTAKHLAAIKMHGPCPHHRRSFKPIR